MKKKVLIIIREFIPYSLSIGSCMRVIKMAEFFAQNGMEVFILSGKGQKISYFGYENLINKVKVIYVPDTLIFYLTSMSKSLHETKFNTSDTKKANVVKRFIANFMKYFQGFVNEIFVPDVFVCTNHSYYKKTSEIIENEKIKNVIISSPNHSIQLVGLLLKKKYGDKINLIVDYRDSWNGTGIFKKKLYPFQLINEYLEKKVLKNMDYFTYAVPLILKKINEKYFDITKKSLLVMNGYDENINVSGNFNKDNKNDVLTIGHFGSISDNPYNNFRNPELFFKALLKFNRKIKLCFYGSVTISKKWQDKMNDILEIGENLSHTEALKMMQKMDVLLMVHSKIDGGDEPIPAKFFEYILVEKPILLVGPNNMEIGKMIKKDGLGYVMDIYSEQDMLNKTDIIYRYWETDKLVKYNKENFKKYSRQKQYKKILEILI